MGEAVSLDSEMAGFRADLAREEDFGITSSSSSLDTSRLPLRCCTPDDTGVEGLPAFPRFDGVVNLRLNPEALFGSSVLVELSVAGPLTALSSTCSPPRFLLGVLGDSRPRLGTLVFLLP